MTAPSGVSVKSMELWRWQMIPATTGKPYNTRHHISEADALALLHWAIATQEA